MINRWLASWIEIAYGEFFCRNQTVFERHRNSCGNKWVFSIQLRGLSLKKGGRNNSNKGTESDSRPLLVPRPSTISLTELYTQRGEGKRAIPLPSIPVPLYTMYTVRSYGS